VSSLSTKQVSELKHVFTIFTEGQPAITVTQLHELMDAMGIILRRHEVEVMMEEVDHDGGGELEFDEFLDMIDPLARVKSSEEQNAIQQLLTGASVEEDAPTIETSDGPFQVGPDNEL